MGRGYPPRKGSYPSKLPLLPWFPQQERRMVSHRQLRPGQLCHLLRNELATAQQLPHSHKRHARSVLIRTRHLTHKHRPSVAISRAKHGCINCTCT
jgi:hypothetical protein